MYLVDTNVFLERLLGQSESEQVGLFLSLVPSDQLLVTDFTLHSIGIILSRFGRHEVFLQFVRDMFIDGAATLVCLEPDDMLALMQVVKSARLDFDDAYQWVAASKNSATLVSFDGHFDSIPGGRKTPVQLVQSMH